MKFIAPLFLAAGLLASCSETNKDLEGETDVQDIATEEKAVMYEEENTGPGTLLEADEEEFKEVNFDAPVIEEPALEGTDIELRGEEGYEIYSFEEDVMFATDKAEIREEGEQKLNKMVDVINNRSEQTMIRVYGFTDARASKEYNMELSKERAQSVQDWLVANSKLDTESIKVVAMGEKYPEATNATPAGRQQNRRVEIVVIEQPQQ